MLREKQLAGRTSLLMEITKSWSEDWPCIVTVVIALAPQYEGGLK